MRPYLQYWILPIKNVYFKTVKPFSGTVRKLCLMRQYLHRLMPLRPHLKRINMVFLTKISW